MLGRRIKELERRPSPYRTSFHLEEVDVVLRDGTPLALMLKDVGPDALSPEGKAAKPEFIRDSSREIRAYRALFGSGGRWAPKLHGSLLDSVGGRYWLLMERLSGRELFQVGDLKTWHAAARWLAHMHAHLTALAPRSGLPLLCHDRLWYNRWADRALEFGRPGPLLTRILDHRGPFVERLLELPACFVHGELYASNVVVEGLNGDRVRAVDWELAGFGPGLSDLAALTSGAWSAAERRLIAEGYREALPRDHPLAREPDFTDALRLCRVQLVVQWLGWSPVWSAPVHHAHDWRAEGEHLAGEVIASAG
jgi:Ser/Thr protein kinase RdoA (MazF antagonist)